ncbi:fungal-specific transcription factor domain-containing protein, partial [Leptodontidium sp. 2 PMI_412]
MENPPTTEKVSSQPASESNQSMGSLSGDRHFFGAPSAISFLNQMRNAVQQKFGINDPTILPNRDDLQTAILGMKSTGTQRYKQIDYVLPGRRKADKLLSMYWETVHPLYPFLGKQTFLAQYETLWVTQKGDRDDPIFLCSLNLIFAISSQLDEDISPNERQSSANGFFERAKESLDLWHLNTLQSVQMLLLLSIHLQSLCYLNQSWMIIGVAIRTAQSLGLHLCETSKRIVSQRERELVRKVWHTCVLLDRMVSMNYGRPSMITASRDAKAPLPLPVDEELLTTKDCPPMAYPNQPSTVEFFVQSLRLFDILDEVLVRFHPDHLEKGYSIEEMLEKFLGRTAAGNNWSILDIDRRLLKWEKDLPAHLKIEYTSLDWGVSRTFSRQGVLLRQRYLHIRLLSLSPLLSAYLCSESGETSNELSLSERIAVQCSVLCVKIAQEMIELGYGRRPADPNSVGLTATWWNYVLPIYSAATVLIAARLSPSILSEISEDSILQSWSCAIDILKSYQVFNPMIQRCLSALELIYR